MAFARGHFAHRRMAHRYRQERRRVDAVTKVFTTLIGAFPVLVMAAAIVLIPLLGDGPPQQPKRTKQS